MADETGTIGSPAPPEGAEGVTGPENGSHGPSNGGEAPAQGPNGQSEGDRDESGRYLGREAATYRRRLRETETERDSLRAQVDALQRAEVERLAAQAGLAAPEDVWSFGASLETLRGDTGDIDAETVTGLVGDLLKDRPGLRAPVIGDLGLGRGATAAGRMNQPKVGLSALLKG